MRSLQDLVVNSGNPPTSAWRRDICRKRLELWACTLYYSGDLLFWMLSWVLDNLLIGAVLVAGMVMMACSPTFSSSRFQVNILLGYKWISCDSTIWSPPLTCCPQTVWISSNSIEMQDTASSPWSIEFKKLITRKVAQCKISPTPIEPLQLSRTTT